MRTRYWSSESKLFETVYITNASSYLTLNHWPASSTHEHAPTITSEYHISNGRTASSAPTKSHYSSINKYLIPSKIVDPIASEQGNSVYGSNETPSEAAGPPTY